MASHVVSSASQSNRGLAVSNPLGTKCVRAGISHPGHSRSSLSHKSNWKRAGGGKCERQDSELEFRPTCLGGDTDSVNKLSNKAMGSLGQGMSTEIHCLLCLTCSALPLPLRKCSVLPRAPEGERGTM